MRGDQNGTSTVRLPWLISFPIHPYTLAVSPSWGVADNTKETTKTMGFHSVLSAMTRDPAEFGWHYVVVLGDLNARVGDGEVEGVVGKYGVPGEN